MLGSPTINGTGCAKMPPTRTLSGSGSAHERRRTAWCTDATSAPPGTDIADRDLEIAPAPGGTLFRVVRFPPDDALPKDDAGQPALFRHETATTDCNLLVAATVGVADAAPSAGTP